MIYLETERLVLRDWREEDSVVFSRMNRDPKVMEYFLKPLTDTESRVFMNASDGKSTHSVGDYLLQK